MIKRLAAIAVFTTIYLGLAFGSSQASLFLRQPSVDLFLSKGQVFQGGVILENISDKTLEVKAAFVDGLDKNGKPGKRSAEKMAKLAESKFSIAPRSIKDLKFKVTVPENASGSYWSGLVYTYNYGRVKGPSDITLNVTMNIEEPFRVTVKNTEDPRLTVKDTSISYLDGTLNINAKVVDSGNTYFDVRPSIIVMNESGNVEKKIKSSTFKAYPDEEYGLAYSNKVELSSGKKTIIVAFDFGEDKIETFTGNVQVK